MSKVKLKGDFATVSDGVARMPWEQNGETPRLARRKIPAKYERYRLYTVDELATLPPVEYLKGTPLLKRELVGLYGKGDSFKSFLAIGWACTLAAHGDVVVYIAAEGGGALQARVRAWQKHHKVPNLPTLRIMPANVNLHDRDAVKDFLTAIPEQLDEDQGHPVLTVIDTLARNFVGGSENDPKDLGEFVEGCESVRRALDCAVLVIHHTTAAGDKERGTESLRNASAAMFKTSDKRGLSVKLDCDRMKEMPAPPPQRVAFEKVEFPEPVAGLRSSLALGEQLIDRPDFLKAVETMLSAKGVEQLSQRSIRLRVRKPPHRLSIANDVMAELLRTYADSPLTPIERCTDGSYRLARR